MKFLKESLAVLFEIIEELGLEEKVFSIEIQEDPKSVWQGEISIVMKNKVTGRSFWNVLLPDDLLDNAPKRNAAGVIEIWKVNERELDRLEQE